MSIKLRVYEVAKDLGMDNKALVALLQAAGVPDVKNHMSAVSPEGVERVKRHLEKQKQPSVVEERIRPTVVKRRAVVREQPSAPSHPEPVAAAPASAPTPSVHREEPRVSHRPVEEPVRPAPEPPPPVQVREREVEAPPPAPPPVVEAPRVEAPPPVSAPEPAPVAAAPAPSAPVAKEAEAPPPAPPAPIAAAPATPASAAPVAATPVAAPVAPPPAPAPVAAAPVAPPVAAPTPPPVAAAPAPESPRAPTAVPRAPTPPPAVQTATPPGASLSSATPVRTTSAPKTGIDVWEGRPGVPMPAQVPRGPMPRRVQYDAKAPGAIQGRPPAGGGRPPMGGGPNRGGPQGRGGMRPRGIGSMPKGKVSGAVVTQERSAHKKIVRIEESIGLQGLAAKIGAKATEVLMKLMRLGMTGVNINSTLDADTAKIVANEFGWEVEDIAVSEEAALVAAQGTEQDDSSDRVTRPPVVTIMGHVDHGKTSLLDQIRKTNVVSGEAGGITQHIGAYSVPTAHGPVTFLDTPGHEAFTAMRMRGAQTTDLVVLVVAADDGVMPQTREAVNHAKAAKVPIVVAINKSDKPEANPERVKRQLSELGLVAEEWGGDTLYQNVSALTRAGVDQLLETIALQAEVLDLRANPNKPMTGTVIEAELDRGRGPVATVLVTDGTLNRGDVILAGGAYGKVRAMHDSSGRLLESAGPSTPVLIIGLNDVPSAGDPVHAMKDMKKAQEIADTRKTKERRSLAPSTGQRAMSLEELAKAMQESDQLELKLIIKADVQGSVEAVEDALVRLSTEKVKVSVVHAGAGAITEGDVNLAVAAGAIIIGFNVRPAGKAAALAQKENVEIRQYSIIYNVVDEVKMAMEGLLKPTQVERNIGKAEVRQVFKLSKAGTVAGCMVIEGLVKRAGGVRLVREGATLWQGKMSSLKRFKDDVRDVKEGFDCGIALEGYNEIAVGDIIEAFEIEQVKQTL
ncbi:MAG TPA: translation initiation factor IF-2 [Polyangiaceae bacterium]|nr:translation initiation factor IF-2 [Polyangiaceae bacterium]